MSPFGATHRSRLKHHGKEIVVRTRHQRPRVQDCGTRWRICYWDYRSRKRTGRTKSWAKSLVPTRTEAQCLADQFMETPNKRNNEPQLVPGGEETLAGLVAICREKMWPLLKNSTRISYDFHLDTYILPKWGSMKLTKLRTIELQDFFNSFSPRLASKTIRNMHGCLRALLNQGKAWELVRANPAQGVRLPRKKARKPPVVLAKQDIRRVIDALPEPTKSIVTLVIVGSLRIGEVAALRWGRIHPDRIEVVDASMKASSTTRRPMPVIGASPLILSESFGGFSMQLGKGRGIVNRKTWFFRTSAAGLYTVVICCGGNSSRQLRSLVCRRLWTSGVFEPCTQVS